MVISPLCLSQFVKHHVPQVVQRFSQLHRVDQGSAGAVVVVKTFQVLSRYQERGDPAAVVSNAHLIQPATHAQQKGPLEQIGHFDGTLHNGFTSFLD
jgi:hypothetical protein